MDRYCPVRWGTKAHGTHCREGETRHNASLEGKMDGTQGPQSMSPTLQELRMQEGSTVMRQAE